LPFRRTLSYHLLNPLSIASKSAFFELYALPHAQIRGDFAELFQGGFEVIDDFLGENVGIGKIVGVFEGFVSEPEDVETDFVPVDEYFVISSAPATIDGIKKVET